MIIASPPPGVVKDGTDLQAAAGRWRDANLIRWQEGVMRPVGGWKELSLTGPTGTINSAHEWSDNFGVPRLAIGSEDKLWAVVPSTGNVVAATPTGIGIPVGTGFPLWSLANYGDTLLILHEGEGQVYTLRFTSSAGAVTEGELTGAPSGTSLMVTPERFLFVLQTDSNRRKLSWSDREDIETWTPAATNQAGDFTLETDGQLQRGIVVNRENMLLTTTDAWVADYIGPPLVYGFRRVGVDCGLVAPNAITSTTVGAFWMGRTNFYAYDGGAVREMSCPVRSWVFPELDNANTRRLIFAVHSAQFNEVWWWFPTSGATTPDRYVAYNYAEDHWATGTLARSAGVAGIDGFPLLMGGTGATVYCHEVAGGTRGGATAYAESGPLMIGAGERVFTTTDVLVDEATQGQVALTFKTRFYPNGAETEHGPYAPANPMNVRFTGRQVRMRVAEAAANADWRFGAQRLVVREGGAR